MKDMKKAPAFLRARRASAYRRACEKAGKPMDEAGRKKIADFAEKAKAIRDARISGATS